MQLKTHEKFRKKYGGSVFYVYSETVNKKKRIINMDVIGEIKQEIERLKDEIS